MRLIDIIKGRNNKENVNEINNNKGEYLDFRPIDSIDASDENIKMLKCALGNSSVKNIALTGPYGSGKSSIIDSYIKQNKDCKYIKISLANFDDCIWDNIEQLKKEKKYLEANTLKIELEDNLEKGILKQIFYRSSADRLPLSRYKRIHEISLNKILKSTSIVALFVVCIIYIYKPELILSTLKNVFNIIVLIILLFTSSKILQFLTTRLRVNFELGIGSSKMVIEGENDTRDTALDKNMDELLYFFEKTEYDTVFIEDLDRYNIISIFVKLREINTILNNYESIKRRIVFVYAIRGDLLSVIDKTKFFDFIIPVIPIVSSVNARDKMQGVLEEHAGEKFDAKKNGDDKNIGDNKNIANLIRLVYPYLTDMRIICCIVNEFKIYKKKITYNKDNNNDNKGELRKAKLLALIIYKNLYPDEFVLLGGIEGDLIKEAYLYKRDYKEKLKKKLEGVELCEEESKEIISYINNINSNASIESYIKSAKEYHEKLKKISLSESLYCDELPEKVMGNGLLKSLLRGGYIEMDYLNYMNFRNSKVDEEFILSVRNQDESDNTELVIENCAEVVDDLFEYEFSYTEVLNISICDFLFGSKDEEHIEKLKILLDQIVNRSDESIEFIKSYLDQGEKLEEFVPRILEMKKTIWIDILCNEYADESNYLAKILEYGSEKGINNNNREFEFEIDNEELDKYIGEDVSYIKKKIDGKWYEDGLYYKYDILKEMYENNGGISSSYEILDKPIKKYIDTYKEVLDKDVERDYGDDIVRKIGDIHKVKKLLKEWEEEQTEVQDKEHTEVQGKDQEKETVRRKIRKRSEERLRKKQKKGQEKIIRKLRLK